jgi:hypothetical protein
MTIIFFIVLHSVNRYNIPYASTKRHPSHEDVHCLALTDDLNAMPPVSRIIRLVQGSLDTEKVRRDQGRLENLWPGSSQLLPWDFNPQEQGGCPIFPDRLEGAHSSWLKRWQGFLYAQIKRCISAKLVKDCGLRKG